MKPKRHSFFGRGTSDHHVKLVGDFQASLTVAEMDEWNMYVRNRPEYAEHRLLVIQIEALHAAISGGQRELVGDFKAACERKNEVTDRLYDIAREWYAGILKRDEEEDAKEEAMRRDGRGDPMS